MSWPEVVVSIGAALVSSAAAVPLVQAWVNRKGRKVAEASAADTLTGAAAEWVTQVQADARAAQTSAQAAWIEVSKARQDALTAQLDAESARADAARARNEVVRIGQYWRDAIRDPRATLDGLRQLAGADG
jgi:acyl-CoA synthetase (AMP-forming)/AMP-acid ligase II